MQLDSFYKNGNFGLSFELYPPKTPAGEEALFQNVSQLVKYRPSYITCTYGAGGSTRRKTLDIIQRVKQEYDLPVASHLTCVGSTVDRLRQYLEEARRRQVDHIVALRGDPPQGRSEFKAVAGGLRYANELVALIHEEYPDLGVAVAGYPETHQEATSPEADLENLKRKIDAGADVVITQLFYDNEGFFRFRDRCDRLGIRAPLIPGILPVTNLSQIQRISSLCAATLPKDFVTELGRSDQKEWQFWAGVDFCADQVRKLIDSQVPGIHFYVLNKSQATATVLRTIGPPFPTHPGRPDIPGS